ncbi:MAG: class B sortase [Dehalococcoidia bacterium]|nr:class B sortase [Dehalococcoidia bacterium]
MSVAVKIGKRAIKAAHGVLDTVVLMSLMLLITIGCYAMWDSNQVTGAASAARYEIYKPTAENAGEAFTRLQAINTDVCAWLTVYGTNIDYPVVQGRNNLKYVNTNAEGKYSLSGAIFIDASSSRNFSDFNSIIYGHHMEKQVMFGEIGNFADQKYFEARPYGMLYYDGKEYGLEFFAFIHTSAYDYQIFHPRVTGQPAQQAYLDRIGEMAIHSRDIGVDTSDRIILLATCSSSSTSGRDILIGRITYETFNESETNKLIGESKAVDGLPGLWESIPLWGKIIIVILLVLFLVLILFLIMRNKRRRNHRNLQYEG